jgi:MFS family permease
MAAPLNPKEMDSEKGSLSGVEVAVPTLMDAYDTTEQARLLRKIDWHVLPYTSMIVLLAFLDRWVSVHPLSQAAYDWTIYSFFSVSISNAVLYGLQQDLKLKGTQYNTALLIFFVPYIVFEVPSNILLKKLRPHVWLSVSMFGFGLVTLLQGFCQNYSGLLASRFFLGLFEVRHIYVL